MLDGEHVGLSKNSDIVTVGGNQIDLISLSGRCIESGGVITASGGLDVVGEQVFDRGIDDVVDEVHVKLGRIRVDGGPLDNYLLGIAPGSGVVRLSNLDSQSSRSAERGQEKRVLHFSKAKCQN